MKTYIYPGSFDPITNGHLDIVKRAAKLCDRLVVAVLVNIDKKPVFTLEERMGFIKRAVKGQPGVEVEYFSGLLVEFAKSRNATAIIKGVRSASDFDYEYRMALLNKNQSPDIETVFLVSDINYSFVSSSAVKEIVINGGKVDGLVPDCIRLDIIKKLKPEKFF